MNIVDRVKNILLQPKQEWPKIAEETTDIKTLYTSYIVILAAIPAVATFIGFTFIGTMGIRFSMGYGLSLMISSYVLSLLGIFVAALVIDALAPSFASQKNLTQALKLCAYSYTAYWVASILMVIPMLAILVLIAGLYGVYLFYLGLPVMMKTPQDKVVPYMIVAIVVLIVVGVVITFLSRLFTPGLF